MAIFSRAVALGLLLITVAEAFSRGPGTNTHGPGNGVKVFYGCHSDGGKDDDKPADACIACLLDCAESGNDLCEVCASEDNCYPICLEQHAKIDVDDWVKTCKHSSLCDVMQNEAECDKWSNKFADGTPCNWVKRGDGGEECQAPCGTNACKSCTTQEDCSTQMGDGRKGAICMWDDSKGECDKPEGGCEAILDWMACGEAGCAWNDLEGGSCRKPCSGNNCNGCSLGSECDAAGCTWEEDIYDNDSQAGHCSEPCSSDNCHACHSTESCSVQKNCVPEERQDGTLPYGGRY